MSKTETGEGRPKTGEGRQNIGDRRTKTGDRRSNVLGFRLAQGEGPRACLLPWVSGFRSPVFVFLFSVFFFHSALFCAFSINKGFTGIYPGCAQRHSATPPKWWLHSFTNALWIFPRFKNGSPRIFNGTYLGRIIIQLKQLSL